MTYAEIRDRIHTGDVLLCRGWGVLSWLIARAQRSSWSHVGLFMRAPEPQWPDAVLVWESTTLGKIKDVATGSILQGVRLVSASDLIATYPGMLAWRPLHGRRDETVEQGWIDAYTRFHGRHYERRLWSLARAVVDWTPEARRDLSSLFCSELAAATWQAMGVLRTDVNPSEVIPRDFSSEGGDVLARVLRPGWALGEAVAID